MVETQYEATQLGEVEGLGMIYQAIAPLYGQLQAFAKKGIRHPFFVTPEETGMIRIAGVSEDWTRTCVAPIAVKGKAPILYKPSPLMDFAMAIYAENCHKNGNHPLFPRDFYEVVKDIANQQLSLEPEDRTSHALSREDDYDLTSEMDDTKFVLRRTRKEYFRKYGHVKIPLWNLSTDNIPPKDKCAVNYLCFDHPANGSGLYCGSRYLDNIDSAFGVLRTGEAGAKIFGYSLTNIKNAVSKTTPKTLERLGLPRLNDIVSGEFEKDILETLRTFQV